MQILCLSCLDIASIDIMLKNDKGDSFIVDL